MYSITTRFFSCLHTHPAPLPPCKSTEDSWWNPEKLVCMTLAIWHVAINFLFCGFRTIIVLAFFLFLFLFYHDHWQVAFLGAAFL